EWAERFEKAGVPIIGDDIKSQVGATIVHRVLSRRMADRGIHIDRTYQLNFGGNMDFMNMLERSRLESKKISKTQAVTSQVDHDLGKRNVHVGPSDYVPWLDDRKWCYIRVEGRAFGDVPINLELKLEVWDSPNSAGVVIDAVRCAKLALDRGIGGALLAPAASFIKWPPGGDTDHTARRAAGGGGSWSRSPPPAPGARRQRSWAPVTVTGGVMGSSTRSTRAASPTRTATAWGTWPGSPRGSTTSTTARPGRPGRTASGV